MLAVRFKRKEPPQQRTVPRPLSCPDNRTTERERLGRGLRKRMDATGKSLCVSVLCFLKW